MISEAKVFYFFKGAETTSAGYTRIDGGSCVEPFSLRDFDTKLDHSTHSELLQNLRALLPRGCLRDVWQTIDGEPIYYNEPTTYAHIKQHRPLCVLFMFHGTPPEHGPDGGVRERIKTL